MRISCLVVDVHLEVELAVKAVVARYIGHFTTLALQGPSHDGELEGAAQGNVEGLRR